jgi:predicted metal-binding membrane protein
MTAVATEVRRRKPPVVALVSVGAAWLVVVVAQLKGLGHVLDHDALLGHESAPSPAALAAFAVAWVFMVAAMMLPSAVPMIRLFSIASATQSRPWAARAVFTGAYLVVWTSFGWIAVAFDATVHLSVERWPWLHDRPLLVTAAVLAVAGGFQLSPLKDACLRTCRHPGAFLLSRYRRGVRAALRVGSSHALNCLGCCWALMLVAFALGTASLALMAGFTAIMTYEKVGRYGALSARVTGGAFLVVAAGAAVLSA